MTAADIVWRLGPWTFVGKEQALLPHENDAVTNTTLEVRNVRIMGNIVEREVIERNDVLRSVGMERRRHYSRIVFDDRGLVTRKEAWKKSPDDREAARLLRPMRRWITQNYPEDLPDLDGPPEKAWGYDRAMRMREIRGEWIAAGQPGLIKGNGE